MPRRIPTEALLETLYHSVSATDALTEFLEQLSIATRSHAGMVLMHDYSSGRGSLPAIVGMQADAIMAYEQRYSADNVWMERIAPSLSVGSFNHSDAFMPLAELRTTTFWREYLSLVDIDHCIGITGALDAQNAAQLSLCRSHRVGLYNDAELELCRALTPHWVNACQIRRQLGTLHDTVVSLQSALDRVGLAVVFVDANGYARRVNHGAERLLSRGNLIILRNHHLVARDATDACRLSNAIAAATHATDALEAPPPMARRLLLHDASGLPAAFVNVHPLAPRSSAAGDVTPMAAVFIRSMLDDASGSINEVLAELFGLTTAEANLAGALYATGDLAAAAHQLALSAESARSRLKLVFDKTGTHGQPALVKLIGELHTVLHAC